MKTFVPSFKQYLKEKQMNENQMGASYPREGVLTVRTVKNKTVLSIELLKTGDKDLTKVTKEVTNNLSKFSKEIENIFNTKLKSITGILLTARDGNYMGQLLSDLQISFRQGFQTSEIIDAESLDQWGRDNGFVVNKLTLENVSNAGKLSEASDYELDEDEYQNYIQTDRKGNEFVNLSLYLNDGADEDMIAQNASEDGIEVDWDVLNKEISDFERLVLNHFKRSKGYGRVMDQGHDSRGDLIISVVCEEDHLMRKWIDAAVEETEAYRFNDPLYETDEELQKKVDRFMNKTKFFHLGTPNLEVRLVD